MQKKIEPKNIIVTGANKGLGFELCKKLCEMQ